jgi:dTMP kinase
VPLLDDISAAFHNEAMGLRGHRPRQGFFIALEGGEGAGKSTQAARLAAWLESLGHDVLVTHEPGGTEVGRRLRAVLLDHPAEPAPGAVPGESRRPLSPRAEALLFAADRAEHVAAVIRPALALGHIVVTDRYVDSSVAYQGAGRDLAAGEVAKLSRWATDGLVPDLTVLLDLPPAEGLARAGTPDRLESEPLAFHERVRERFLQIARHGGSRYLVLDAARAPDDITADVRARLEPVLPLSAEQVRAREHARRLEEERARVAAEARRLQEARARADAEEAARRKAAEDAQRRRREAAELEERRRQAAAEAAETARLAAIAQQEQAAREAEREAAREAERAARAQERRARRSQEPVARDETRRGRPAADPPTRELSLTDELFGGPFADDDDEEAGDATVQLPRVTGRGEDR